MSETIQTLAGQMCRYFRERERDNGESFWAMIESTPQWCRDVVCAAHDNGNMPPDDYRYQMIQAACESLDAGSDPEEPHDWADTVVSVYCADRARWYASRLCRQDYVAEARDMFGSGESVDDDLGRGWYLEACEVYQQVVDALQERLNDLEEAA